MTLADCERVAEIRIRGWQSAYAGLIPQSYLDGLDLTAEVSRRRAHFEQAGEGVVNLVAVGAPPRPLRHWGRNGEVVGWACHGPYRDGELPTKDAELYAIYVHPDRLSQGVGHALLRESKARCTDAGHDRMLLWVLKENARARRFYERAGFTPDGTEEPWEVAGVSVPEVRYSGPLAVAP
ncbi:GNAT family N-acetyltransferase [Streptomyces sp. NPDC048825]|uniref:GNAT family N-acetyltransferase n=1 Tax=Streptomyces sp. NPDC048825 TaxID=3365592 RepID=UPI003714F5F5